MRRLIEKMILPSIVLIWAFSYYLSTAAKSEKAVLLISPACWILAVVYAIILVREVLAWKKTRDSEAKEKTEDQDSIRITAVMAISTILYLASMQYLGFIISTVVFLFGSFCLLKARKKWLSALLSVVIVAIMWVIFKEILGVPLFEGLLKL